MGNGFCYPCSPCKEQEISTDILELEGMQSMEHVEELIVYIDRFLEGQGLVARPNSVAHLITSGGDLIDKLSKRLKRHVCKKCFLSALDRQTRSVVVGVISQAQPIPCIGMALSITAYLLERAEQVSSNNEQCLYLLRYMSTLAKHMKNLDIHLGRPKLDDILCFIVKGTLMCALLMQPSKFCRFIFAPLDAADLENLKLQLLFVYPDLALEAVTEVFNRLPIYQGPSQGEYPLDAVGIEEAQKEVTELLDLTEPSPRVVVIYGVGGIGKTTLATAVFKSLDLTGYHYCRVDMDQDCKQSDLQNMQEQILRNLFKENLKLNNCTHGREKLSEAFGKASKPVFLFIDNALRHTDVEMLLPMEHLSGLPTRSRILLTTRSRDEDRIFRLQGIQVYSHRVDSLPEPEAKRLLCHYALGDMNGSFDAGVNMDGLVQICEGIPLVLQIIGSHLRTYGDTPSACNEILEYYKQWQRTGLEGGDEDLSERIIDFVYRRLTEPSREAFLDIVFFFHDWERSMVGDIVGEMELRYLEGAALVTTSEEHKVEMNYVVKKTVVKMHEIVRARGRKLSEGNRVTDRESLSILLNDEEQKLQQTKGIWLPHKELSLEAKQVDLMRSLRVLSLGWNARVNGRCERAFEDLRFLQITYEDMLPIQLRESRQLVCFHGHLMKGHTVPELPESLRLLYFHATNSGVSLDIKGHHTSLRELHLSNITLANFENSISQIKSLRSLQLDRCEGFTSFPESFGNFSFLKILTLLHSSQLERFPESLGNLSSLQRLHISDCSNLEGLPERFGNLCSLQDLHMGDCSMLKRLPESFGNLSSLQRFDISGCTKLERLPECFGNLSSLQNLDISDCYMLERLPESFGNLSFMQYLAMHSCSKLETLPESFGNLSQLQDLDICHCSTLEKLPESFGNLSCMQDLTMRSCSKLESFPESFGNLSSLQDMDMVDCSMLERLPESFGNLSSLQRLDMSGCSKLERLPESWNLSSLQRLDISGCSKLERLPESLGSSSSLQILRMHNCSNLEGLPQTFDQLSCLQRLEVEGCVKMCSLFDNFGQLKFLKFLSISYCKQLKRLPEDIISLTSLTAMAAYGCFELETKAMDSLVEIKSLMFLEMGESPMLIKRWEEIQQHHPLIGAALRFERGNYPYEEIISTMFFSGGSRFLLVDGEGQLVEAASSSFPDLGAKVGLLLTACDLSNEVRQKLLEVASELQIIYVDVEVEGSSWMEEREKRIRKRLLQLPEGSRAWTSHFHKNSLLFAYSLWHFTGRVDTSIVGTSVLVDEEGRRKLSHLEIKLPTDRDRDRSKYSGGVKLGTLFSPLWEASEWMVYGRYY